MTKHFHTPYLFAFVLALFPFFASALMTTSECATLGRNLRAGMEGADVLLVQKILNSSAQTMVAPSGIGSNGQESTYFGGKTKSAIVKFQEFYRSDILVPAGLLFGNGYVGSLTRAKLVKVCEHMTKAEVAPPPPPSPVLPTPATTTTPSTLSGGQSPLATTSISSVLPSGLGFFSFHSDTPELMFLSANSGSRGSTLGLSALGLSATGNVVHLGNLLIADTKVVPMGLSFVIPADAPRGKQELWFTNEKGESNKRFFVVTDPGTPGPTISSYTPKEGFLGTKVTVTGSGFLPTGNDVLLTYGWITGVSSSDGKTLEFTISPDIPGLQVGEDRPEIDYKESYWFNIVNDNGISEQVEFIFKA